MWGIISDFDLLRAGIRPDAPDTAAALARQAVIKVETTAGLRDTAELMMTKNTGHVVAVDPADRLSHRDPVDAGHRGRAGLGRDVRSCI